MRPSALTRRASTTSSASSGSRSPSARAARRAARTRPRRTPPTRPGARSRRAACRPAAGPARARARSCPPRSRRSGRSAPGPRRSSARSISSRFSTRSSSSTVRWCTTGVRRSRGVCGAFGAEAAQSCCRARLRAGATRPGGEQERVERRAVRRREGTPRRVEWHLRSRRGNGDATRRASVDLLRLSADSYRVQKPRTDVVVPTARADGRNPLPYAAMPLRRRRRSTATGACHSAAGGPALSEPAARTARAAGGRSSRPAAGRARRTRARTRRGCPPPPAARTAGRPSTWTSTGSSRDALLIVSRSSGATTSARAVSECGAMKETT